MTLEELEKALRAADRAAATGNAGAAKDAKILAAEYVNRKSRTTQPLPRIEPPPEMPMGEQFMRGAGITARGALPVAIGAMAGAPAGPAGMIAGGLAVPAAEALTQAANVVLPQNYQIPSPAGAVENLMTMAGLPVPQTTGERALQAASGALTGTASQLGPLSTLARTAATPTARETAGLLATAPGRQLAASAPAAAAGEAVTQETQNPWYGMATSALAGAPFGVGARAPQEAPTREMLQNISRQRFTAAREAGIQFDPEKFGQRMSSVEQSLRAEGYTPTGYPALTSVFNELKNTGMPKDFTELNALRKMIMNAQASQNPAERRLSTVLKDEFDDYVLSAPQGDVVGAGTKAGAEAWREGRNVYSRLMKSEVFEKMLEDAQLDVSKFTQSGTENSLAQQLRQLAKNPKRMRMFTKDEQEAIKKAAKGGTTQNLLKFYGRFSPTSSVGAIFGGGASVYEPTIGVPFTLGAMGARVGATKMRERSIEDLAAQMRAGMPLQGGPNIAPGLTGARGLLSPLYTPYTIQLEEGGVGGL